MAELEVCELCGNARWVVAHNGLPWHGVDPGGRPCPSCNDEGGDEPPVGYNLTCLSPHCPSAVSVAEFIHDNPHDQAVICYKLESQLGFDMSVPDDVIDYTKLDVLGLLRRRQELQHELRAMGEMPLPRTQRGRDLHSELAAAIEVQRSRPRRA